MLGLRRWRPRARARAFSCSDFVDLYESTPIGAAVLSPRGRFLKTNTALQRFLGYSSEELLDMDFDAVTYREDLGPCRDLFAKLRRGEIRHFQLEKRYVRRDGAVVWAHVIVCSDPRPGGQSIVGLAVDISERKRAEEAERRAERELERLRRELEDRVRERTAELQLRGALLAAIQETSIDGIIATDLRRRVLAHNGRLVEMWGAPETVARSLDAEDSVRHAMTLVADPRGFLRRVIHLYRHRMERSFDYVELRDGRVFERYSAPILGPGGQPMGRVWNYRDVTERRAAERELERRTEALRRSNADLETYAYAASHDLSAPVRKISAYAELLERSAGPKLGKRERDMLGVIGRAARRMSTLIEDVLTFRRLGAGELVPLRPVDLAALIPQVLADIELAIAEAGADVRVGPLPVVLGQESQLARLFQNLLSNALKFRRPGVRAQVRLEARDLPEGFVEVSVSDNGIGFEPRFADKIFLPLVQLNPNNVFGGSGLGLAICRRIAQACGGSIQAGAQPGGGAVFRVRLRRAPSDRR